MRGGIKSICVYCGSRSGQHPVYASAAIELANLCANQQLRLVFGGGSSGLMGILSKAAIDQGVKVTGVIPSFLTEIEPPQTGLDELHYTDNMHHRKQLMAELADAFVILPGGLGTLDECFEILAWKQLGLHKKPIVMVNIDHYWDSFAHLLEQLVTQGFAQKKHLSNLRLVEKVSEVYPAILDQLPYKVG